MLKVLAPQPQAFQEPHQNVNFTCISSLRLLAFSEKPSPFTEPAIWLARPKRGDVMLPMIGPGLVWLKIFRADIEIIRLKRRSPPLAGTGPKRMILPARRFTDTWPGPRP